MRTKLLVRAADYGMLDCCTDGCLKAIRDGILMDVAMHTNNPSAVRAAEEIKKYPWVSIGQEINIVSGVPASDPKDVPTLVNEEGRFYTSREREALGDKLPPMTYEDAYTETENQVLRFIELIGRKPCYVSGHSYGSDATRLALADVADKYGILIGGNSHPKLQGNGKRWYKTVPGDKSAYTMQMQMDTDVEKFILDDELGILGHEYGVIGTHCGYCDEELVRMSSFNVIRTKELYALTSPRVKQWVKDNDIELINFDQFAAENEFPNAREAFLAPNPEWQHK